MSVKRKPAKRTHKPGSEAEKFDQLMRYQRALREHERDGHVSDPELAARIRAGWHPGVEMAVMTIQPDVSDAIKAVCLKTLLENVEAPKAAQLRLDASGNPDVNITVLVAPWAAVPGLEGAPKAIPMQPAIDVTAHDPELEAHGRSSAPAPEVFNPAPLNERHAPGAEPYVVERGADGLEHAVRARHEQPPHDAEYEIVHDDATGVDIRIQRYRGVQDG
jgi:hypothetical protein